MELKRWLRPLLVCGVALLVFAEAQSEFSGAEASLNSRIGRLAPTATLLRDLPAGAPLSAADVGFPMVPVRWRQPGAFSTADELNGLVAASQLRAGTTLGLATSEKEAPDVARALRPGERIVSTTAVGPAESLQPGMLVEVMLTTPGRRTEVISRKAIVVSAKPIKGDSGLEAADKVQVEIRTGEGIALKLASAESSGAEVRLVPASSGR